MTGKCASFLACLLLAVLLPATSAPAVAPDEQLADAALEVRAREIGQQLRCVVCQNQSIDDSNAPLAHDLRQLVRERLTAGDTDAQAIDFIVARYGNFVLLKPPMQGNTILLWFGPAVILVLAGLGLGRYLKRQAAFQRLQTSTPLTRDEQERLEVLLNQRGSP